MNKNKFEVESEYMSKSVSTVAITPSTGTLHVSSTSDTGAELISAPSAGTSSFAVGTLTVEPTKYGTGKPRRVQIRATIMND